MIPNSGILTISVDTRKVENMINGYIREIPKLEDDIPKKIAQMYAHSYLQALHKSNVTPWTGESFVDLIQQSQNPVRLGKGNYGVVVRQYLVALDQMKPHFVSLKRGRSITRWAKDKLGYNPGKIIVRPHPWIRSGNISAGKNRRKIAENEVSKFIRNR